LRPCQDYRYLNSHTVKNAYPLPLISDLIDKLKGSKIFTKFDIRWGYNNVQIKPGDRWKAAFITPHGLFEPNVMFFGLCNSPPTFQALMDHIFQDYQAEGWLIIYMDDLLIHSTDPALHRERTMKVLKRLKEHDLYLKLEKCKFDVKEVDYLGLILKEGVVKMDPIKLDAIAQWNVPENVKAVRSFLGFCNFYRRFIPSFSNLSKPLTNLTKKDVPWEWSPDCESAFRQLQELFMKAPVLSLPDTAKPFFVMADASLHATGGVLMQKDVNGELHPCAYLSQTFSPAERNYDIYDRELLAVIRALKAWRHYLQGTSHPLTVLTDHKNLTYFRSPQNLTRRQARWLLFLADFDLTLEHVPGTQMTPADALSRYHSPDTTADNQEVTLLPDTLFARAIDFALVSKIKESTPTDPLVLSAVRAIEDGKSLFPRASFSDWDYDGANLLFKKRLYIPPTQRKEIVTSVHESLSAGHPGITRTINLVSRDFWWPGLSTFVRNFVTGCATCQSHKANTHPSTPALSPIPSTSTRPFQQVSVDLITDLPVSDGFDSLM
ncbi:hypothetical protein PAXINDRAFT_48679, partial [Paxillus involutus ATCC 200175]